MKPAEACQLCILLVFLVVFFNSQGADGIWSVSFSMLSPVAEHRLHKQTARTNTEARSVMRMPMWSPIIENVLLGYSAHWDAREVHGMKPPYVRLHAFVVDASKMPDLLNLAISCRYWRANGSSSVVLARIDRHLTDAMPLFILCPNENLSEDLMALPESVSLECAGCASHWTFEIYGQKRMREWLTNSSSSSDVREQVAMCVRPTFGPFNNDKQMIQFLIYYSIMGISHFTFYSTNGMAPNAVNVVEKARSYGMSIDVLPWNLQFSNTDYNQYLAINACLYWQSPFYEHSVVVDTDEYIVIRGPDTKTIPEMLATLDEKHPRAACYLFQHFLFSPLDEVKPESNGAFDLFSFTARQNELFPPPTRSKVICKSDRVVTATVHHSAENLEPYEQITVDSTFAGMFHFRSEKLAEVSSFTEDTELLKIERLFMDHPLARAFVKGKT